MIEKAIHLNNSIKSQAQVQKVGKKVQLREKFSPLKHEKPLKIKDFEILVKFWLLQSDVAHFARSDVMPSFSRAEGTLHRAKPCFILHAP